ncbi:MAG: F0F1 ATP synthase subunit delta [Verrucomicrobia bacterium]|nr:F0F1 ATP synthase subunit delta [Verrucomicrobiota bacterium]
MKISKQARRDAKSLFVACRANGLLDEGRVSAAVREVVTRKPRGYVSVLHHFQRLVRLEIERRTARVESATPLSPELQQSVRGNLTRRYGPGLNLQFSVNASLVGGLRVQVGSDVYDGSVAARLTALSESF